METLEDAVITTALIMYSCLQAKKTENFLRLFCSRFENRHLLLVPGVPIVCMDCRGRERGLGSLHGFTVYQWNLGCAIVIEAALRL